jgi:phosphate acetyltransferase
MPGEEIDILEQIRERARAKSRQVVLPEGEEPRTVQAAKEIIAEKIAEVTILGNRDKVTALAGEHGLELEKITLIDPNDTELHDDFTAEFMKIRVKKTISEARASETMKQPLHFGAMMVHKGMVDGSVAGAVNTTGNVLRAGIQVIGLAPGIKIVSGAFMMTVPNFLGSGKSKVIMYGDGAVVPNPNAEELASIAISTAETHFKLTGEEPKVAMLSFSTKGSANHPDVDKVLEALSIVKETRPDLKIDGELQVDAAIIPDIAKRKGAYDIIEAEANVFIFPDLDAGNIAYKLTQRLARASATGPIVQGLRLPANDLSRGCSAKDIVDVTAIAMLMKG